VLLPTDVPAVPVVVPAVPAVSSCLLQALDYVLQSAAWHGVRLILVLGGTDGGGTPATYMRWVRGALNLTGGCGACSGGGGGN
jgi:hypothetical protein